MFNLIFTALMSGIVATPPLTCSSIASGLSLDGLPTFHQRVFHCSEPVRDVLYLDGGGCLEVRSGDPELPTVSRARFGSDLNEMPTIETSMESEQDGLPLLFAVDQDRVMHAQILRHKDRLILTIFESSLRREVFKMDVTTLFGSSKAEELSNGIIQRPQLIFSKEGSSLLLVTTRSAQIFDFAGSTYKLGDGFQSSREDILFGAHHSGKIFVVDSKGFSLHGNGYSPIVLNRESPLSSSPIAVWHGTRTRIIARPRREDENRLGIYRLRQGGLTNRPQLELEHYFPSLPHSGEDIASGPDAIWVHGNTLLSYNSEFGTLVQTNLRTTILQDPSR